MRDTAVTFAKGVAIMLMVLGHACYNTFVNVWVNMFHMSAFFFLSGYCFKDKYLADIKSFVKRKFKSIYWPFLKWSVVFILFHNIFYHIGVYNSVCNYNGVSSTLYSLRDIVDKFILLGLYASEPERLLGGYWFLPCLFWGSLIFVLTISFFDGLGIKNILCGGCVLLTFCMISTMLHKNIFFISYKDFLAAVFIWIGYAYRKCENNFLNNIILWCGSAVVISLGALFVPSSFLSQTWQKQIPFIVISTMGSVSLLGICRWFELRKFAVLRKTLVYIGNNTLVILTWHFLSFVLVSWIVVVLYDLPFVRLAEFPVIEEYSKKGWCLGYFLVGISIPLLLLLLVTKIKCLMLKKQKI